MAYESKSVGIRDDFTSPLRTIGHFIAPAPRSAMSDGSAEDSVAAARMLLRRVVDTIVLGLVMWLIVVRWSSETGVISHENLSRHGSGRAGFL